MPKGGEAGLSDDEVKAKAADFYGPELKERLAKGAAEFDLMAILGEAGDATPIPRHCGGREPQVRQNGHACDCAIEDGRHVRCGIFDPTNVTTGIEGPRTTASIKCARRLWRVVLAAGEVGGNCRGRFVWGRLPGIISSKTSRPRALPSSNVFTGLEYWWSQSGIEPLTSCMPCKRSPS